MANIKNLNESLMKRIEALEDENLTDEQLEMEIKRSQAITKVADTIINCARIFELKERGYIFHKEKVKKLNRYGKQITFDRYKIVFEGGMLKNESR